jgi:hypothetical protein
MRDGASGEKNEFLSILKPFEDVTCRAKVTWNAHLSFRLCVPTRLVKQYCVCVSLFLASVCLSVCPASSSVLLTGLWQEEEQQCCSGKLLRCYLLHICLPGHRPARK